MFVKKKRETPELDKAIDEAIRMLDPDVDTYLATIEGIERLTKLKEETQRRVSPDTLAIVAGNLVGILMILHYEHVNVVTSKALGFVQKLK